MSAPSPCPEVSRGLNRLPCTRALGHDAAHEHIDEHGRWLSTWITPEQFEEARARGDFDHHFCHCDEPEPGDCLNCGGEIL